MTMIMGRAQRAAIGIELPMLLVLAAVNFTSVVDFLIIMPLGPQYLRELNITSAQFGLTVSAYGIAAGLTGILVSIFLDRVNRKNALLGIYAGFTLATLFCGLVSDYPLLLAVRCLPSIRVSMREANEHQVTRMLQILSRKDHQKALLLMALMTGSSFFVLPYLSNYLIANVGIKEAEFPLMYLCGGFCTIFSVILIGRWADRAGKPRVFCVVSWLAIVAVLILTNLPRVPVAAAIVITTLFMVCVSGRSAPVMAHIAGGIDARYRGSFMSLNSSIQQITSGVV